VPAILIIAFFFQNIRFVIIFLMMFFLLRKVSSFPVLFG